MKNKTIFIGDIHGCYKELKLLIKKLNLNKEDKVFFVGDYINKGPKSYKVIKYLYKNREQFSGILGNHDLEFINNFNSKKLTHSDKKLKNKLLEHPKVLKYFQNLPLYIDDNNFILIHGGLNPKKTLEKQTALELTNIREIDGKPWYDFYKGKKKIIYGHWALQGIHIRENTIGLDSGCCYGKYLSAYILETGELIQQKALKTYVEI
ncbi:MAG: metallophosphoesterase [Candidatus Gracilibacteria bacterium]|nr:metallophosphoesterase [Candidatus Gracilibacteria bacterium]